MQPHYEYDAEVDLAYVELRAPDGGERGGRRLDERRYAIVDQSGRIFAYEFLAASRGIDLGDLDPDDQKLLTKVLESFDALAVA